MKNIILIDDTPEDLAAMASQLLEINPSFNITSFDNPNEAKVYVENTPGIDIVIIDFLMPEMNGLQLAIDLVEFSKKRIPTYITSSYLSAATKRDIEKINGIMGYFKKPILKQDLESVFH